MKRIVQVLGFVLLAVDTLSLTGDCDRGVIAQEEKKQGDAKPQATPKGEVYSTSPEQGLKKQLTADFQRTKDGTEKPAYPYSFDLKVIYQDSRRMGASNIFL